MNVIHPLTDAQKRKRRPSDVLEDGESLYFSIALMDSGRPAGTASAYLTDTTSITCRADFTRALAAARFADGAKLVDMPEGSTRAIGATASANSQPHDSASGARASIDALRLARYS